MKVIKPQRLGLLCRAITTDGRRYSLAVAGLVSVPFQAPRAASMETALWKDVAEHIPGGLLDEGYAKVRSEVLVHGAAIAQGAAAARAMMTRVCVTRDAQTLVDKRLAVQGDRFWIGDTPSEPAAFTSMPVDWAHSFGGEGHAANPLGKGAVAIETEEGTLRPLPNIEDPQQLVTASTDTPQPAGYGVVEVSWPQRMAWVGKEYGGSWLAERFPGPAADFDPCFYNTALTDQQFEGPWRGDETIRIEGMHPDGAVEVNLAPLVVKAIVTQQARDAAALDAATAGAELATRFEAHPLSLETVHLLPNVKRAILIYRGVIPLLDDEADDIVHLMLAAEDPNQPKTLDHYAHVLAGRLDKDRGALLSMRDDDLMPSADAGWLCKADYGPMVEQTAVEHRALKRGDKARRAKLSEAQAELEAAGFDVAEHFEEPRLPASVDPFDVDGILLATEEAETMSAALQAQAEADKELLQAEARQSFAAAGFDYDAEAAKAMEQAGGPPAFSADAHLATLFDLARIADAGGQPMHELERDLLDPSYALALHELQTRVRDGYRSFAHVMPTAALPAAERQQQLRVIVMAARDSDTSLSDYDLTGADLHDMDLSGVDLSGAQLERANLRGANLHRANLARAVLTRADLTHTDLSQCDLTGANLGDCQLIETDLSEAVLVDTVMMRSELRGARLQGARFEGTDFLEVTFHDADFSHAHCKQVLFLQADMRNAVFAGAELTGARFLQVDLRGVVFAGARLDGAQFVQCNADGAEFAGASMVGVTMAHETTVNGCSFAAADLTRAMLHKCPLTHGDFTRCILNEANVIKANLTGATLYRIVARKALFMRANCRSADLRGADLLETIAQRADFRGADLRGANLARGDVSLAHFDAATRLDDILLTDTRIDPRRQPPEQGRAL